MARILYAGSQAAECIACPRGHNREIPFDLSSTGDSQIQIPKETFLPIDSVGLVVLWRIMHVLTGVGPENNGPEQPRYRNENRCLGCLGRYG